MKKLILIRDQILSGNLGDCWKDNNETADTFAEFIETTWRDDLSEFSENYTIIIDIDVQHDTEGNSNGMTVDCDIMEVALEVENLLTTSHTLWDRFCNSDSALELAE